MVDSDKKYVRNIIMWMFKRKVKNQMSEKEALRIFMDYLTGIISTEDFWKRYTADESLRNALINDKKRNKRYKYISADGHVCYMTVHDKKDKYNPDTLLDVVDINNLHDRYKLYSVINRYVIERGIFLKDSESNADIKEFTNLYKMQPSWVEVEDVSYLQKIFAEAPQELTYAQKLKWGSFKIRDLFRYVNKKPIWIQQPEWPIKDGKPLLFVYQKTAEEGFEQFFFFDVKTGEEVVIEQCE